MPLAARALVLGAVLWCLALFAAPGAACCASPGLSRAASAVYAAGSVVCHQRPERSFAAAGRPLPVCARCTGLYLSAAIGGILALAFGRRPLDPSRARWIVALCCVPTAATWSAEFAGLVHPSNMIRASAAIPLGIAAAWLVVTTLQPRTIRGRRVHAV